MKKALLSALYGCLAGMAAAAALWLMGVISHLVWAGDETRGRVIVVIMLGGVAIGLLRAVSDGEGLADQLRPHRRKQRDILVLAAMAIVAVGFGGAVGPEAGMLALVAELSALVSLLLARDEREAELIDEVGAAATLGGLYGSPPGGAMVAQEQPLSSRWELYLAGLTGLLGFLLAASWFLPEQPMHIALPAREPARDGSDLLWAVLPGVLGAAIGLAFVVLLPMLQNRLARLGHVTLQTLVGTACFALLAAWLPILRFSGHHQLSELLQWGQDAGMAALLALAALKVLALAICLASGWRGGAGFPLLFAGAAAGGAALAVLTSTPPTVALVAGMTAALVAGMGKPLAATAIALLLLAPYGIGPLCVGAAVGWAASRLVPKAQLH